MLALARPPAGKAGKAGCLGATLVELLLGLALAGILLGIGMPSYQTMIERQQLRTAANDLLGAVDLARSQAIARGARVTLAPLDPDGVAWKRGWVVFSDDNGNGRADPDERRLFQHGPVADGVNIVSAFSSGAATSYLAYNSAGRSCGAGNSLTARWGTLSLLQGEHARHIKINMLGRARLCDPQRQPQDCSGVDAAP